MESTVSVLLKDVPIPKFFKVRQKFDGTHIAAADIPHHLHSQLCQDAYKALVRPGMRIAITAGSRGIRNIAVITHSVVDFVRECGATPIIVPAMGSHGGATAQGQKDLLREYGISEESMDCPVASSMETVCVGKTPAGEDVYIDHVAREADGIIVVGRVKPHTGFRGPYESGLMKMMAIGLGKQRGAEKCHEHGFKHMARQVPEFGRVILQNAPVLFGVAIIENAYDQTYSIEAVPADQIEDREPQLLKTAFAQMPCIHVDGCDVLVVDQIGKNYSGDGMDPNITGTFWSPYAGGGLQSERVVVLDIHPESHGNFSGLGMADASTQRAYQKIDMDATYANAITCKVLTDSKIPCILPNDKEAVQMAIRTCTEADPDNMRIVRIPNSLHVEEIWLSESYYPAAAQNPKLAILGRPEHLGFDLEGNWL